MTRHTRRRQKKLNQNEPIEYFDDFQQERMISKFKTETDRQEYLFKTVLSTISFLPTPVYIFKFEYRKIPKLSFLSLVCLFSLQIVLRKPQLVYLRLANLVLSLSLVLVWVFTNMKLVLLLFPMLTQVSEMVVHYWIMQSRNEITVLESKRYDLRGV